jgi:pentatricopeptide repeat protein
MFLDLLTIWGSAWTTRDYETIFEVLMWSGTFEESMSTMTTIQERDDLKQYPNADCWARLLDNSRLHPNENTVRNSKEAWDYMRQSGVEPSITAFNALLGAISPFGEAFEFVLNLYQLELLPSRCSPNHITLRCLLEAHMTQTPTPELIAGGNTLFDQLLDLKQSKSSPGYWNPIVKWMLFRGDSLSVIKHALYEQSSALGRNLRPQPDDTQNTSLTRTMPDYRHSDTVTTTLDQLIGLALRIDSIDSATTIYNDFFPALHVSPTVHTDELMLELLLRRNQADQAKSLYDDLHYQGHLVPASTVVRLIRTLSQGDHPLPLEAQSVFFDLLDIPDCAPETYAASFSILANLFVRLRDYPRLRQTLQDRNIDRVPNWQNILSSVCLEVLSDPRNVWLEPLIPIYHIVQRWAPNNITLSHRHTLMHKLVSLGRTDLGLELFHDMRHSDISQPTRETYAIMLTGCGKTRDAQTLEHIHNALRLDSSIEPDSALFNCLMLAYNRSRLPEKSLAIWEVLSQSSLLPDVEAASLALEACIRLPRYGLLRAREIWTFMEDNDIDPSPSSYAALLSVFASVGKWDGMMGLLERMERNKVDAMVLGTAYNNMRRDRKEEVERWARVNRPGVWEYLESIK